MRKLAAIEKIDFIPEQYSHYHDLRAKFESDFFGFLNNRNIGEVNNYRASYTEIPKIGNMTEDVSLSDAFARFLHNVANTPMVHTFGANLPTPGDMQVLQDMAKEAIETSNKLLRTEPTLYKFRKIYFPTLRGLRPFEQGDLYATRTKRDYFYEQSRAEIFTGLTLYNEIQSLLLGNLESRRIVKEFQDFLSTRFFENKPVALIPKLNQDVLDIKIGDEKEFPIQNLGDGIQSIIILTFPLFKYQRENVLAFFEEPEMFMHPGMQRVFLNVLTYFKTHQYFLTTHSNHFLDITLDIQKVSVFTLTKDFEKSDKDEKEANFLVENVSNEDVCCLELLGVRNSSVFLTNCTIWIEGITDRRYLAHFLSLFQGKLEAEQNSTAGSFKRFREDLHFSFVEYGGSNITHWSFLDDGGDHTIDVTRLCGKLFLITDKDSSSNSSKVKRHEKLRTALGDRYCCLDSREIENLLTPEVIAEVVNEYEGGETELNVFVQGAYTSEPLGGFIEDKVLKAKRKRTRSYAAESGTISDKVNFCQKAIGKIKTFDDLSPEAKTLAQKLYNFIKSNNT